MSETARGGRLGLLITAGALLGAAAGAGLVRACGKPSAVVEAVGVPAARPADPKPQGPVLLVPPAVGPIVIDGELEDPGWTGPLARTGAFLTDGTPTHPYSDARFVHRDGQLFIVLYAADEDLRATDAGHDAPLYLADAFELVFRTELGEFVLEVSPTGVVTDARRGPSGTLDFGWESHARVAVDRDGTLNDPSDQDEEWVVEMALPLDAIGLSGRAGERIGFTVRRCDLVPKIGRVCGAWGVAPLDGRLVLGDSDDR